MLSYPNSCSDFSLTDHLICFTLIPRLILRFSSVAFPPLFIGQIFHRFLKLPAFPKELQALPKELQALPKELQALPKELQTCPKELRTLPEELQILPKACQVLPKELQAFPETSLP